MMNAGGMQMLRPGLCALLIVAVIGMGSARAQDATREMLQRAEDHYQVKEYEVALDLVDRILTADTSLGTLRLQATFLKARCLTRQGQTTAARTTFQEALALDPDWQPDRNLLKPDELNLFDDALAAYQKARRQEALPECETLTRPLVASGALITSVVWFVSAKGSADDKWDAYTADPLHAQDLYDDYTSAKNKQDIATGVSVGIGLIAGYSWWRYIHNRSQCRDGAADAAAWQVAPARRGFVICRRF